MAVSVRSRALTFLVGTTRAYRQQLDQTSGELRELNEWDLTSTEQMVNDIKTRLHALDELATRKLRDTTE